MTAIGRLLAVDWAPNPGGDKMLYLFDGGRLTADEHQHIALQANELRGYAFHDVVELPELTIPRLGRPHHCRHPGARRPYDCLPGTRNSAML